MTRTSLSIIVVSYNTRDLLRQCLASVAAHLSEAEVVVVDNASRDGSAWMVRDEFPGATLIDSCSNDGFAAANNLGLKIASGEFVVLLNSDTVLEDDSLARCARWMRDDSKLGAASPLVIGVDGLAQPFHNRFPSLKSELRKALRRPPEQPAGARDPRCWLAGTALMIRRSALADVGGELDDAYFMYWEDADLSARLRAAGWDVARFSGGHVVHHGGASGGGDDSRRRGDLAAWNFHGKHRWFARHRGAFETVGLWCLSWTEVVRMTLRAARRPTRRHEFAHARALAAVLGRRLLGLDPPRPARRPPSHTLEPRAGRTSAGLATAIEGKAAR